MESLGLIFINNLFIFTLIILEPFQSLENYCLESFPSDGLKNQKGETSSSHRDHKDDEDSKDDGEEEIEEKYDEKETEVEDSKAR